MNYLPTQRTLTYIFFTLLLISTCVVQGIYQINNTKQEYHLELVKIDQADSNGSFGGFNLFVIERHDAVTWNIINRTLVISDLKGNLYFSKEIETGGPLANYAAEFINSTTILYGDSEGACLFNIETNTTRQLSFYGHHDYEKNYANNTYFALSGESIEINNDVYLFDRIIEYSDNGTELWNVNSTSFVNYTQWCPYEDMEGFFRDVTHSNTIFYDEDEDCIYLNSRNLNTFYKIDHKTGELLWSLGEYGNFTLFDLNGNEKDILFYHAHALEKIAANKFMLFDNDEHNQTNVMNHHSRLLEITIDIDKKYANASWEWISPVEYFRGWWGDSDLLPNNNRMGVFKSACLVEVNETGDIVWEYDFTATGSNTYSIYKAERFCSSPVVSAPIFVDEGEGSGYLEWNVWYNYRSKTEFTGKYHIMVDNEEVELGPVVFPKYWQSIQLRYNITSVYLEAHEFSLIVEDEGGHLSNITDRFSPIGSLSYESITKSGLILGLSLGLGIPFLAAIITIIWRKIIKKKPLLKRKIK